MHIQMQQMIHELAPPYYIFLPLTIPL
jgi:hypothetical protein